jgi:hypothetical protein
MMDMILSPNWVHAKLEEIQEVFEAAYREIYNIIKEEDVALLWVILWFGLQEQSVWPNVIRPR